MDEDILVFNGIDGSTGLPSWPALRCAQLVRAILAQADPANLLDLRIRHHPPYWMAWLVALAIGAEKTRAALSWLM